jgi:hypothetical protein
MGLLDDAIREHLELKRRRGADAGDVSRLESEALGPVRRRPDGSPDLTDMPEPPAEADLAAAPPEAQRWEGEQTAVLGTTPAADEPPSAGRYELPPTPAYEPPPVSSYTPPTAPAYEPPVSPPEPERQWFERAHDDPETRGLQPDPQPAAEPEPEHPSLLSRFRAGRKPKPARRPESDPAFDEPASSYEPPPLPSGHEAASAYEPPPATPPPSYRYEPPTVQHESDIVPADEEPDGEDVLEETPDFLEETPEHDRLWFEQRPPRDFDFDG